MNVLRSRDNARYKHWRAIAQEAKIRRAQSLALLIGEHLIEAALQAKMPLREMIFAESFCQDEHLLRLAALANIPSIAITDAMFSTLCDTPSIAGIAGVMALPVGNTGAQMAGWYRKEMKTVADFNGLKMRVGGLAGKVLSKIGVVAQQLPPGDLYPALEKGVIDAAEFVGPFQDRRLGLHKAAKYYYTTGWHESATVSELLINRAAWQKLPKDLQAIVENAAAACNVISEAWCQKANSDAMDDLVKNHKVVARPLPEAVIKALRGETEKVLAEAIAKDPLTRKVHDSYFAFKAKYDRWSEISEEAYHVTVRG